MTPRRADDTMWSHRERTACNLEAYLKNEDLLDWCSYGLCQIWTWAGHVSRLPVRRLVNRALHSEGILWCWAARFLGESLGHGLGGGGYCRFLRWEHDIEQFCELEQDNVWLDIAQDRDKWRILCSEFTHSVRIPCGDHRLLRRVSSFTPVACC